MLTESVIKEEFLDFLHCYLRFSGKVLTETVLGGLINLGLDFRNCWGQGFHEAAAVSKHINGYLHIAIASI